MIHRPQTWLITGASGFLGRALVDLLQQRPNQKRILISRKPIPHRDNILQIHADLNNFTALNSIIDLHKPDIVLNLAGRTPPASDTDLWNDNAELTFNLLNGLKSCQYPVRLVHAGSAAELGEVPLEKLPVDESYKPEPVTTYGKSKWAASEAVLQASGPITPMVARIFNLIGPGQSTLQAFGRYAAELAAMEGRDAWSQHALVHWHFDPFPVTGEDLFAVGMQQGKAMGDVLRKLKNDWADSGYVATKEELLALVVV